MHQSDKERALQLLDAGGTPSAVARQLGLTRDSVRHLAARRVGKRASPPATEDTLPIEYRGSRPLTLPELIAYYQIDETQWEVQTWKANVWEQGTIGPDGKVLQRPLHQTSATFKRRKDANMALVKGVLEDIKGQRTWRRSVTPRPTPKPSPYVLELCLFDLHLAKLAWAEETGEAYDLPIAVDRARTAVADLLTKAKRLTGSAPRLTILPLGNDYFHYDHITGLTTAGTPQDRDSRYAKMFRTGRALASEIITLCADLGGVRVPIIPGNHDRLSCFTMGEVLKAEFDRHAMVNIDNSVQLRKYVEVGQVLLGYTHGSDEKVKSLPQLMATEAREAWGRTRKHEWHLGHLHKRGTMETVSVNEELGCVTRYISSLTGTDAWHYSKGYVGNAPAAEAFIWNTEKGHLDAHLISEV